MEPPSGPAAPETGRLEAGRSGPAELPRLAIGPVAGIAVLLAALLIAFSDRYGYHRDELYFLACGQHLAWGYPDQPPFVPLVARLMTDLAPGSLVVLRLPSALAAAALILLTGLLTRELGGRRAAQMLACAAVALAPLVTAASHLLSTTTFDLPAWALLVWLLASGRARGRRGPARHRTGRLPHLRGGRGAGHRRAADAATVALVLRGRRDRGRRVGTLPGLAGEPRLA